MVEAFFRIVSRNCLLALEEFRTAGNSESENSGPLSPYDAW